MNSAKLLVFLIAAASGAGSMFLMKTMLDAKSAQAALQQRAINAEAGDNRPTLQLDRVLVASQQIEFGTTITAEHVRWQEVPPQAVSPLHIVEGKSEFTTETFSEKAYVARVTMLPGDPLAEEKILEVSNSGLLSVMLREGMRATAIEVNTQTAAGGFVLPGDYVDVLLTRRISFDDVHPQTGREIKREKNRTETIFDTVRVLAADQQLRENTPGAAITANTLTIELLPEQVENMSLASQVARTSRGNITVSLRGFEQLSAEYESTEDILPVMRVDLREELQEAITQAEENKKEYARLQREAEEKKKREEEEKKKREEEKLRAQEERKAAELALKAGLDKARNGDFEEVVLIRNGVPIKVRTPKDTPDAEAVSVPNSQ